MAEESEKRELLEDRTVRTVGDLMNAAVVLPEVDAGQSGEEFPDEAEMALVGTVFAGQFEIEELVGKGGMSVVYRAKDQLLRQDVAIKTLHTNLSYDQNSYRRFQQEAATALSLDHQNIVRVRTFGIQAALPYMVMDLLEGCSLSDLIKGQAERLPIPAALHIFSQTCSGLAHAHAKGIVHRDIKPSNIMLVKNESDPYFVKILDFGIAKLLPQEGEKISRLTQTGEIFGSPLYMCPEQWSGKAVDSRSDVYSLGCVLYEALNGKPPHYSANVFDTMHSHLMEIPAPFDIPGCDPALLERLETVTFKALEKHPDKRYQSMNDFKRDLDSIAEDLAAGKLGRSFSAGFSKAGRNFKRAAVKIQPWKIAAAAMLSLVLFLAGTFTWLDIGWFLKDSTTLPAEFSWTPTLNKLIERVNASKAKANDAAESGIESVDGKRARELLSATRVITEISSMQRYYTKDELESWKKRSLIALNSGMINEFLESRKEIVKWYEHEEGMCPLTADAYIELAEAFILEGVEVDKELSEEMRQHGKPTLVRRHSSFDDAEKLLNGIIEWAKMNDYYKGDTYCKLLLADLSYMKAAQAEDKIHKLYARDKGVVSAHPAPEDTVKLHSLFDEVNAATITALAYYAQIENLAIENTHNKMVPCVQGAVQAKMADLYRWRSTNEGLRKTEKSTRESDIREALKRYSRALTYFKSEKDKSLAAKDAAKAAYYIGYLTQESGDYNTARIDYAAAIPDLDQVLKNRPVDRQTVLSDYARVLWKSWDFMKALEVRDRAFKA